MNFELFIAKRIIKGSDYKKNISSPIIKIAVLAIALGIIIMMISVAIAAGMQHKIRDKISGFKGHVIISNYDNNNSDVSLEPINKNQNFYPNFSKVKEVKSIHIFANKPGVIRTESNFEGIVFKGVSNDYNWNFFKEYLVEGSLPNFNQNRTRDILVSRTLVNNLSLKLNDTINIFFFKQNKKIPSRYKLIISGIYATGFNEFDKNMIIGDIREIQRLNKWNSNQIGGFEVFVNDFNQIEKIGEKIFQEIGLTLNTTTVLEKYPFIFDWIKLFDNNIWFIIGIMILVASINMITALLVLILERVQLIGLLKALGCQSWSIRKIFLYNAGYLILKGLFWGNLIGIIVLLLQQHYGIISLNPSTYYVSKVPIHIDVFSLLLLNISTLILCIIMLIVPSIIITKIKPAKSIKFA